MTRRGSILVAVLMLLAILFVLGLAMLTKQYQAYQGATLIKESAQAQAVAEAGLEDARVKWQKDLLFPPAGTPDQTVFSYSEDLTDSAGKVVGSYEVRLDQTYAGAPTWLLRILVVGTAGPRSQPGARKTLLAELDLAEKVRTDPSLDNPNLGRFLEVQIYDP